MKSTERKKLSIQKIKGKQKTYTQSGCNTDELVRNGKYRKIKSEKTNEEK